MEPMRWEEDLPDVGLWKLNGHLSTPMSKLYADIWTTGRCVDARVSRLPDCFPSLHALDRAARPHLTDHSAGMTKGGPPSAQCCGFPVQAYECCVLNGFGYW